MFLPASHGFDEYLGIPYSADMGDARATPCGAAPMRAVRGLRQGDPLDNAGAFLPLLRQTAGSAGVRTNSTVLEQPLDFSTLGPKYNAFMLEFVAARLHEGRLPFCTAIFWPNRDSPYRRE